MENIRPLNQMSLPLPHDINLLTPEEIDDLTTNHPQELTQYVTQLHQQDIQSIISESENLVRKLQSLKAQFEQLEVDKHSLRDKINAYDNKQEVYVSSYEQIRQLYLEQYSEEAFMKKLQLQVQSLDNQSQEVKLQVSTLTDSAQLDALLSKYQLIREQYHYYNEQLLTWQQQDGVLKR